MKLEAGKPIPEPLRSALYKITTKQDWAVAATEGAGKYTIRDAVRDGFPLSEKSVEVITKLIDIAREKAPDFEREYKIYRRALDKFTAA